MLLAMLGMYACLTVACLISNARAPDAVTPLTTSFFAAFPLHPMVFSTAVAPPLLRESRDIGLSWRERIDEAHLKLEVD
jgi:hypothetical protein